MAISDTDQETERILTMMLRTVPVWRKLQMLGELNQMAQHLALEGLRDRNPSASEAELRRYLADLLLGPELTQEVYGPLP